MADADIKELTVSKDGQKLGNITPAGSLSKQEGKALLAGKWDIPGVGPIDVVVSGKDVSSVQAPFGNMKLLGEIEESEELFGMHVNMGGFPMKAWLTKDGAKQVLAFSNGARWSKL